MPALPPQIEAGFVLRDGIEDTDWCRLFAGLVRGERDVTGSYRGDVRRAARGVGLGQELGHAPTVGLPAGSGIQETCQL